MSVTVSDFGLLNNEIKIEKYTITNVNNVSVSMITYGATLTNIFVPDKNRTFADILVGFDDIDGFVERSDYQGVIVGPVANRIGGAAFKVDGKEYKLTVNENDSTCLHSAGEFNTAVWDASCDGNSVTFKYTSPDGLNGFPGNINVSVKYSLNDENELKLEYSAVSDKKTPINLTNHAYFNLGGYDSGTILNHIIEINADKYTEVDKLSIPTGNLIDVNGTPFDLRKGAVIGNGIDCDDVQLQFTGGFDHNFCISDYDGSVKLAAKATDPNSGRVLEVYTDLPGVQFYAGNFLSGIIGKGNKPMNKRCGFCLETQFYPDTPNVPSFPQCTFDAGEEFKSTTIFKFSVN